MGGAIAAVLLALAGGGCVRTMSLGAAGTDGGDAQVTIDATALDHPVVDATPNDTGPDGGGVVDATPNDVPVDQTVDGSTVTCTDNGVTYHAGDVIPRGCNVSCLCLPTGLVGHCTGVACPTDGGGSDSDTSSASCIDNGVTYHVGDVIPRAGCQLSCLCLAGGVVGACTGIPCWPDASADATEPAVLESITLSASSTSPEIDVQIDNFTQAVRMIVGPDGSTAAQPYPLPSSAQPVVLQFLSDLAQIPDLAAVGDPNPISQESCPKSATSGTVTKVRYPNHTSSSQTVTSGDLQCLINPTSAQVALAQDAEVLLGLGDPNFLATAQLCVMTGGQAGGSV